MAKLYFRYGPRTDTRDGERIIRSRIGLEEPCLYVEEFLEYLDRPESRTFSCLKKKSYAAVIVDEAQFLTAQQVDQLSDIVDDFGIPVLCYGLRTDFTGHLFEGSKRLMEIADVIEEVPTVCWCGRRAHYNTRIKDGRVVRTGEQIMLGGNETYVSLCRKHYKEGRISK